MYHRLLRLASGWADRGIAEPMPRWKVEEMNVSTGLYIACDIQGEVLYVGSAKRTSKKDGVHRRIKEHSLDRRLTWEWFWILPLKEETPLNVVRAIEGQVIDLLEPPMNRRRLMVRFVPSRTA
jgi:hypothetical protein